MASNTTALVKLSADVQEDLEADGLELLRYRRMDGAWQLARAAPTLKVPSPGEEAFRPDALWEIIDSLREQQFLDSTYQHLLVGTAATVTALSTGYVIWMLRGGYLIASLLASLPAWRLVDPLAILDSISDKGGKRPDDEGLAEIIQRRGQPQLNGAATALNSPTPA